MTAKTCKLLCFILILSCDLATAQTKWIGTEKAHKMAAELFRENVISIDNMGGHLWVEAMGNAGSVIRLHIEYKGFYIRSIPNLTNAKRGLMKKSPSMTDTFEIVPKAFTVNMTVSTKKHCVGEYGQRVSTMSAKLNKTFYMPEPPGENAGQMATADWMYKDCWTWLEDQARHEIVVKSRQADGGQAYCTLFADVMVDGNYTKTSGNYTDSHTQKGRVSFGTGNEQSKERAKVKLGGQSWILGGPWPIDKPFSLEDMSLSYSGSTTVAARKCPTGDQTLSDTSYTLRYQFTMAPQLQVDAELEPVDSHEKAWMPTPGETREYRIKLIDPGPENVQGVKFVLNETSEHKGIVTNGGNHVRGEQCPDCTVGVKDEPWPWEVFFPADGEEKPLMRHYTHYNQCPIDTLPDVFFTDADNPGYTMGDGAVSENLQYTVSQSIETDKISGGTYTAKLKVMDGAASARLQAYVKVGGFWYPARAAGQTASDDGIYLMLPLDKDQDGIHDTWEKQWGAGDPEADNDSLMGNPNRGDGLTVFEEYRGVYAQGRHFRLSPVYIDVFVHDYSGNYNADLREVAGLYRQQEINLWRLAGNEFKYDCINYDDGTHKKGNQYIVVVVDLIQCPGLKPDDWLGVTTLGPPNREHDTVVMLGLDSLFDFIKDSSKERTVEVLAHEIGHMMALPHHGDTEGFRTLNGDKVWIACLGGQHSGDASCFMTYKCADKFINLTWVPKTNLGRWLSGGELVDFRAPEVKQTNFCTTPHGSGQCGDATKGNCLSKIKIKSY